MLGMSEVTPESYFEPLRIDEIFGRKAPLQVDIGSGEGAFVLAMAARHPEHNFLAIERLLGRVRKTLHEANLRSLHNLRVLRAESAYSVRYLLPKGIVQTFHVAFPDPWPKRRHWQRRLINTEFLQACHAALAEGGELRLKTDHQGYFEHMRSVIAQSPQFKAVEWPDDPDYPRTNFERKFEKRGLPIYRARLIKV